MPDVVFQWDPNFFPKLDQALLQGMDDAGREARDQARRNSTHASIQGTIYYDAPRRIGKQIRVNLRYRKGLGPIFEKGTVGRYTKGRGRYRAGAYRGIIDAELPITRAVVDRAREGLDLTRYI